MRAIAVAVLAGVALAALATWWLIESLRLTGGVM